MEEFLKRFSTIPDKFIKDFYMIAKETYLDDEKIINLDIISEWLEVNKENLKRVLKKNFEENFDYTDKKVHKKIEGGSNNYHEVLLSPNCFRELCMISNTPIAKQVRKYFMQMEKLVRRYHEKIQESLYKEIGLLKNNQKPKVNIQGGLLYILPAQNTIEADKLYKIGLSEEFKTRLGTYNTGNANDIEPLFIIPVNDVNSAEKCIKAIIKNFQYRKRKEVYEIDLNVLKSLIESCAEISNRMIKYYEENKKDTSAKLGRMKNSNEKYYLVIIKNSVDKQHVVKSKSKSKSKTLKIKKNSKII